MTPAKSTPINEELITQLRDKIVAEYQPEKIILFGSAAEKDSKPNDVDLFIVKDTKEEILERGRIVRTLFPDRLFALDVIVYTPKEVTQQLEMGDFFVRNMFKKGRILYDSNDTKVV